MNLDTDDVQKAILGGLADLLDRHAGPARAHEVGGAHDDALLAALTDAGYADVFADEDAGPLVAHLAVEQIVRRAGCIAAGADLIVGPALLGPDGGGRIAVAGSPDAPVRYGAGADTVLVLDGDRARAVSAPAVRHEVDSAWGASYVVLDLSGGTELGPGSGALLRRWWQAAMTAEIAGALAGALDTTVRHLTQRTQFNRPLASFQALQHRLAEAYVTSQEVLWLGRTATADNAPAELAALAAGHAVHAAKVVANDMHQLSGAIGFTLEYDLQLWTLPLEASRLELGGWQEHLIRAATQRWLSGDLAG